MTSTVGMPETIREGEGIIVVAETANRDSAVFPDPGRIDIHRDARVHELPGTW